MLSWFICHQNGPKETRNIQVVLKAAKVDESSPLLKHATEVFLIFFHNAEGQEHPYSKGHVKSAHGSIDCCDIVRYGLRWELANRKIKKYVTNPDLSLSKTRLAAIWTSQHFKAT